MGYKRGIGHTGEVDAFQLKFPNKYRSDVPRYFIDFQDDEGNCRDEYGSELTREGARQEAVSTLREIARSRIVDREHLEFRVAVRDQSGNVLYRATLKFHGQWTS